MGYIVKRRQAQFVPHPEGGPYRAVLARIVPHPGVETQFGVKDRLQIVFQTEIQLREHVEGVTDLRPFELSVFVNDTIGRNSRLRDILETQYPAKQLEQMLDAGGGALDLDRALVGTQWLLSVEHSEGQDGRVFANVSSFMRARRDDEPLAVWDNEVGFLDVVEVDAGALTGSEASEPASSAAEPVAAGAPEKGVDDDKDLPF